MAVINCRFQNGETTCCHLSKRLPNDSTIFAAEATATTLVLECHWGMDPRQHYVVVYSDLMSCLQAIEYDGIKNPFICCILNLLWALSDKGSRVRFYWMPCHCCIKGNGRVHQLAWETLEYDIDPLASVHYADLKPLINSSSWLMSLYGRAL